jgi:hypothetical protein
MVVLAEVWTISDIFPIATEMPVSLQMFWVGLLLKSTPLQKCQAWILATKRRIGVVLS